MRAQVCNLNRNVLRRSRFVTCSLQSYTNHMPSIRVSQANNNGIYFLTMTVLNWYYLFDRHNRWNILADSLMWCIDNKNLKVFAYVFMLNHIHLIVDSTDIAGFIRDFKKFTSKQIKQNLVNTEPQVLSLFEVGTSYQFWQKTNMPLLIETEKFLVQKINYIHNNPVRKHYVEKPEYWYWSSANPNSQITIANWNQ